ncbi:MAG: SGNH/GDSL hydrolase family protein [Janthinobacterium lividum]
MQFNVMTIRFGRVGHHNDLFDQGEKKRQALNDWIHTSGAYDGVINFAAVVQDPNRPSRSRPEFDSGDHLHPSPAGYAAVANSIDLKLLQAGRR